MKLYCGQGTVDIVLAPTVANFSDNRCNIPTIANINITKEVMFCIVEKSTVILHDANEF